MRVRIQDPHQPPYTDLDPKRNQRVKNQPQRRKQIDMEILDLSLFLFTVQSINFEK